MSLRDRIEIIVMGPHDSAGDCADAILADPEIAALREVAEAVKDFMPKLGASIDAEEEFGDGSDEYWEGQRVAGESALLVNAALARLGEAKK